jgi:pimeloyl-ACP methyl ester carboxylesterase
LWLACKITSASSVIFEKESKNKVFDAQKGLYTEGSFFYFSKLEYRKYRVDLEPTYRQFCPIILMNLNRKECMKTFILVHGSWHSAWNWHKVVPILEKKGHNVVAIDLLGMGRDKTPIHEVTMQKTVEQICDLMDSLDGQVILVGHSKNGIMISQAAELRPHKVEKLIYLAAYLIPSGKTQREYSVKDIEGVLKPYVTIHTESKSTTLQSAIYKEGLYHDCPEDIVELAKLLLSHEPIESGVTPLQLTDENYGKIPRFYIECTEDRAVTPFIQRKMYTEMPCEKVYQMPTSHSPFFSQPDALAAIFCEIAVR